MSKHPPFFFVSLLAAILFFVLQAVLMSDYAQYKTDIARGESKVDALRTEHERLAALIQSQEKNLAFAPEKYMKLLDRLETGIRAKQDLLAQIEDNLKPLQEDYAKAEAAGKAAAAAEENARKRIQALETQLTETTRRLDEAGSRRQKLDDDIRSAEFQKTLLKQELDRLAKNRQTLNDVSAEIADATARRDALSSEAARLKSETERLAFEAKQQAEARLADQKKAAEVQAELLKLTAAKETLEKKAAALNTEIATLEQKRTQTADTSSELWQTEAKLQTVKTALAAAQSAQATAEGVRKATENELNRLKEAGRKQSEDLAALTARADKAAIETRLAEKKVSDLRDTLRTAEQHLTQLNTQTENAKADLSKATAAKAKAEGEFAAKQAGFARQLSEAQTKIADAEASAKKRIADLEAEIARLEKERMSAAGHLNDTDAKLRASTLKLTETTDAVAAKMDELQKTYQATLAACESLKRDYDQQRAEAARLATEQTAMESVSKALLERQRHLRADCEQLKSDYEAARKAYDELRWLNYSGSLFPLSRPAASGASEK